jgi:hypothetical protein
MSSRSSKDVEEGEQSRGRQGMQWKVLTLKWALLRDMRLSSSRRYGSSQWKV